METNPDIDVEADKHNMGDEKKLETKNAEESKEQGMAKSRIGWITLLILLGAIIVGAIILRGTQTSKDIAMKPAELQLNTTRSVQSTPNSQGDNTFGFIPQPEDISVFWHFDDIGRFSGFVSENGADAMKNAGEEHSHVREALFRFADAFGSVKSVSCMGTVPESMMSGDVVSANIPEMYIAARLAKEVVVRDRDVLRNDLGRLFRGLTFAPFAPEMENSKFTPLFMVSNPESEMKLYSGIYSSDGNVFVLVGTSKKALERMVRNREEGKRFAPYRLGKSPSFFLVTIPRKTVMELSDPHRSYVPDAPMTLEMEFFEESKAFGFEIVSNFGEFLGASEREQMNQRMYTLPAKLPGRGEVLAFFSVCPKFLLGNDPEASLSELWPEGGRTYSTFLDILAHEGISSDDIDILESGTFTVVAGGLSPFSDGFSPFPGSDLSAPMGQPAGRKNSIMSIFSRLPGVYLLVEPSVKSPETMKKFGGTLAKMFSVFEPKKDKKIAKPVSSGKWTGKYSDPRTQISVAWNDTTLLVGFVSPKSLEDEMQIPKDVRNDAEKGFFTSYLSIGELKNIVGHLMEYVSQLPEEHARKVIMSYESLSSMAKKFSNVSVVAPSYEQIRMLFRTR